MGNLKNKSNHPTLKNKNKAFLICILFMGLIACEDEPETITSKLDLTISSADDKEFSDVIAADERNILQLNDTSVDNKMLVEKTTDKTGNKTTDKTANQTIIKAEESPISSYQFRAVEPLEMNSQLFGKSVPITLIEDKFYPLGWSNNGRKFAYAVEHDSNGAALFSVGIYIQDLVSDEIIWQVKSDTRLERIDNIADYWQGTQQKIMAGFNKYKINLNRNFELKEAPIFYAGDRFSYSVKVSKTSSEINTHRILLHSRKKGNKEISNIKTKAKTKHAVVGHFQGTDKTRIATLVATLNFKEQDSGLIRYKIIGASLKYGKWN